MDNKILECDWFLPTCYLFDNYRYLTMDCAVEFLYRYEALLDFGE